MQADHCTKPGLAVVCLLNTQQLVVLGAAVCVLFSSLVALLMLPDYARQNAEQSRVFRVEEQRSAQAVKRLQSALADNSLKDFDVDLSGVRINLLETLEQLPDAQGVLAVRYKLLVQPFIQESAFPGERSQELAVNNIATTITRLRISIRLRLLHSAVLGDVLDRIRNAARSWPLEVRACELQRAAERAGIDVQCAIDVVHWAVEIDARGR